MARVRVAAVQASYVLMDQQATLDRVAELTGKAAAQGAQLVVFPEVFVPGTPIWIDTQPIWDGDDDWFRLLAENAVVVPGAATERLGAGADGNVHTATGLPLTGPKSKFQGCIDIGEKRFQECVAVIDYLDWFALFEGRAQRCRDGVNEVRI